VTQRSRDLSAPPSRSDATWSLLEQCATPMAVVDSDLVVCSVNQGFYDWVGARARNWRGEDLAVLDAKPPRLSEAARRALAQDRRIWLRDARLRTAIGDRAADLALTPLDVNHLLIEVQSAVAEHSGLRLSESLRGFAHEVKGPLAGVRGAAQLLQRRVEPGELSVLAQLIVDEVDRLATLSDRLLHAGVKPRLARANIHEIIERVASLLLAESDSMQIRRDYDPSLPSLSADADRLQQALLNLARNAAEARATQLTVRTRAEHGMRHGDRTSRYAVRVDNSDDGAGVPIELSETLFEPLVSGRANGSGLGLAIAREIAREHGGELTYTSRPGATVFSLLLPLAE
jgi:two-component system nitrogen regulation sensor histidine kinase GlnL